MIKNISLALELKEDMFSARLKRSFHRVPMTFNKLQHLK